MSLWEWLKFVARGEEGKIGKWPPRWQDRLWQGHVHIGPVTLYGANAMHWAVRIWSSSFRTFVCFHPTTKTFNGHWPWYLYVSPNATPWAATWSLDERTWRLIEQREKNLKEAA